MKGDVEQMHFQELGYRDYIAARVLLNNDYLIQGATLGCTAVEKYLKSLAPLSSGKKSIHLDKWTEIKNWLHGKGIDIFTDLDEEFIKLLSKIYKMRYYDKIQSQLFYIIMKWQFLGELDFTVNLIESRTSWKLQRTGESLLSSYKKDSNIKAGDLLNENYILNGLNKKDYMERKGKALIVTVTKDKDEFQVLHDSMNAENYQGKIAILKDIQIS